MPSLAVSYRPDKGEDIIGQESIVRILSRQISTGLIKNCYLFCGPSGDGKTTTARWFSNAVNGGVGAPVEIDAASNSGVDNVREIIKSANERALDGKYKVYVIDECVIQGTKIQTVDGEKSIETVSEGDVVYTPCGPKKVLKRHDMVTSDENLVVVKFSNGNKIVTTKNHYFLTEFGWVEAKNLIKGDLLVDYKALPDLREGIQNEKQGVLNSLWSEIELATEKDISSPERVYTYMCNLWERMERYSHKIDSDMFGRVLFNIAINEAEGTVCFRSWDGEKNFFLRKSEKYSGVLHSDRCTENRIIEKNEREKSDDEQRMCFKNVADEGIKWDIASLEGSSWGKWKIYRGADSLIQKLGEFLEIGIPCKNTENEREFREVSFMLQTRPCLSRENDWNRGGWQKPQIEKATVSGCKERNLSDQIRVEGVEIYKRTSEEQSEWCSGDSVRVYDLTIEDFPFYFANGVLVHNCHAISNQGWQAFLKCIEEPPKYTIFIFCTTEVNKVPDTIKNRCQRFNFSRVSSNLIRERLNFICKEEGFTNYEETTDYISKICNGGVRDAISMLEKCASYDNDLSIENCLNALGNLSYDTFFNLINSIIDDDEKSVSRLVTEYYNSGADIKLFVDQFLSFCLDIEKYCLFNSFDLISIPSSMEEKIVKSTNFDNSEKYYMYVIDKLLELKNMIKTDSNARLTVEVVLLQISRGK